MNKIRNIEIRDADNSGFLIGLPEILEKIDEGNKFHWAVLDFQASYYPGKAKSIANYLTKNIYKKKIIPLTWQAIEILAQGVGQFIDLILIGSYDFKKLKNYQDDNEMFNTCDIVIIMFDTSWWEISCKDEKLLNKFINSFNEVQIINWDDEENKK